MTKRQVHIFGGGTSNHIRAHLALSALAYGTFAKGLKLVLQDDKDYENLAVQLHLTKMCQSTAYSGRFQMETNADVEKALKEVVDDPLTKIVVMNCALADFEGTIIENGKETESGKHAERLKTRSQESVSQWNNLLLPRPTGEFELRLRPSRKLLPIVRQLPNSSGATRKDIYLVAFKTTCNASRQMMYMAGLHLLKENSCNLVVVNDIVTNWNMIVTPEEAAYPQNGKEPGTDNRLVLMQELRDLMWYRSQLTFTQSTVVEGKPVAWSDERVPINLRNIVNYCVAKNAYKPVKNSTVGHFAVRLNETEFLTSVRKSNFNNLNGVGLVFVRTDGPDSVIAFGTKPSVGGQSQRTVFRDHPGYDAIVHFHCPLRAVDSGVPVVSQREVECGSHQCGENTSKGLKEFKLETCTIKAVHLDNHGPNIIFSKDAPADEIIKFIETHWDLEKKTGGYQLS